MQTLVTFFDCCSASHCFEFYSECQVKRSLTWNAFLNIWILFHSWFNCIYKAKSARKTEKILSMQIGKINKAN